MGCVQSKFDIDLLKFSKDRKDLIKASRDSWHSLSHVHITYIQSLQDVGNGIRKFTMEVVVIRFKSPLDTIYVDQNDEDVPQSNDSSLESIEDDGDSDPSHSEIEKASDVFYEEESIIVLDQPQTPPSNTTSFIYHPINKYSDIFSNYTPDNLYFPQTRNMGFYHASGFDFPNRIRSTSNFTSLQSSSLIPGESIWENLTRFNSFEDKFPNLYFQGTYETNLEEDNLVTERERIPIYENELHDPLMDVFSTKEESETKLSEDSDDSLSSEAISNGQYFHPNEAEVQEGSERQHLSPLVGESETNTMPTPIFNSTNQHDILASITEVFDTIVTQAKDVSGMLKPFEPCLTLIKSAASKRTSILKRLFLQKQTYRRLKYDHDAECGKETEANSQSLSWTLKKLYNWEKKLYNEIKEEEKLKQIFEKELEKLKKLDSNGAETTKFASQSSLKRVSPKLNVSLSKIARISKAIHEIRRDELQPQLCAYIRGLQKLFKLSFESLQKQVQAVTNSLANIDTVTCRTSPSSQRVVMNLEKQVIKLETAFSCWNKSHKDFVVLLKKWLMKFQEQCAVPDSNPINVVTICEDWLQAIDKVSDVNLHGALKSFSLILLQLSENLHEESRHRLRLQHFSNYHEQKLKRLCKENGVDYEQCKPQFIEAELIGGISGDPSLDEIYTRLRPVRETVREASSKYEEAMTRVNDTARGVFPNGIVPVLAALERFNSEMFAAYEQVGILNERSAL